MHLPTHIMSGWCAANLLPRLRPRDRLFAMVAAAAPDLDGLALLAGQSAYQQWHHRACHNLPFCLLVSITLAACSRASRLRAFLLAALLFHLHLIMDVFGSGPGWGIYYLWPFSNWAFDNDRLSWEFYSWQNITIAAALLLWTLLIARFQRRTPLEAVMPNLDRQLVAIFAAKPRPAPGASSTGK